MAHAIQFLPSQPWIERLGWTLMHFLWQGAAIALLYAAARWGAGESRSGQVRYAMACAALAAMVAAPVITFSLLSQSAPAPSNPYVGNVPALSSSLAAGQSSTMQIQAALIHESRDQLMPWLVVAWLAGAIVFWVRLLGGWAIAMRMRSMFVRPASSEWQEKLDHLKTRIHVSRPVRLLVSALVQTPTVVGWLRPVLLMPIGALAGLPAEHVEALLAHELAHIRRHDYLINILQSIAESLLFYHPAVWWISGHIRNEREVCCDEVAVSINGDVIAYACALAGLESRRAAHFTPALAADGGSAARPHRPASQAAEPPLLGAASPGAVVAAVLIVVAACAVLAQSPLFGQSSPAKPEFDAASIKPSGPFVPGNMRIRTAGGPGTDDPGRVIFEKYVLSDLLEIAYDVKHFQLSGPDWLMNPGEASPRFDITAKIPDGTSREQYRLMLQNLLAERFKVIAHLEKKELPVYNLVRGKGALKLSPSGKAASPAPPGSPAGFTTDKDGFPVPPPGVGATTFNRSGSARLQAVNMSMGKFATLLSMQGNLARPVTDATDLEGEYDFVLYWSRGGTDASDSYPTIFGAVQEQLGLKLESVKGQVVELLVVDRIEKVPTEN